MTEWMDGDSYVEDEGTRCPWCRRLNTVEGDSIEVDGNIATQDVHCSACGAEWTDTYVRTGYAPKVRCPKCASTDVVDKPDVRVGQGTTRPGYHCEDCGGEWTVE